MVDDVVAGAVVVVFEDVVVDVAAVAEGDAERLRSCSVPLEGGTQLAELQSQGRVEPQSEGRAEDEAVAEAVAGVPADRVAPPVEARAISSI